MIAVALVLAALTTAGAPPIVRARYASDIAAAAPDLETALALVATAEAESAFRPSIERCICQPTECDHGRAVGLYQLHSHWLEGHTREDVCSDNALSTRLAARALRRLARRAGSIEGAFARYVGADPGDGRVQRRVQLFQRLRGELAS